MLCTQARDPCSMAWALHRTLVWVCTVAWAQALAGTRAPCSVALVPQRAVVLDKLVQRDRDQLHSGASVFHTENYNPCLMMILSRGSEIFDRS